MSDFRALLATQSRHPLRKVVNVGLESEIKSSFMQYAMSIILVRCVLMLVFGSPQVATKSAVDTLSMDAAQPTSGRGRVQQEAHVRAWTHTSQTALSVRTTHAGARAHEQPSPPFLCALVNNASTSFVDESGEC